MGGLCGVSGTELLLEVRWPDPRLPPGVRPAAPLRPPLPAPIEPLMHRPTPPRRSQSASVTCFGRPPAPTPAPPPCSRATHREDLSSKRLYQRTIHTLVRAKGCQRFSVPATAARDGEEAVLSSSTARNKWGLCASLDGRMSRSDQDPRDPMSRLGPVSPNQAALAPVLACF